MTPTTPAAARLDVVPAGRYQLDPARSKVTFHTRHLFGLAAVTGTMQVVSGEVIVEAAAVPQASVTVTLSATSFDSGHARRDGDVRSAKFLDVSTFPELTFRAGPVAQTPGPWPLSGELTVHGTTQPLSLAVESVEAAEPGFRARATTRIDRYAFGLTGAKGMAARFLDVELEVTAEPRSR
jgi:polyisoprenoid-binding protein YceI